MWYSYEKLQHLGHQQQPGLKTTALIPQIKRHRPNLSEAIRKPQPSSLIAKADGLGLLSVITRRSCSPRHGPGCVHDLCVGCLYVYTNFISTLTAACLLLLTSSTVYVAVVICTDKDGREGSQCSSQQVYLRTTVLEENDFLVEKVSAMTNTTSYITSVNPAFTVASSSNTTTQTVYICSSVWRPHMEN